MATLQTYAQFSPMPFDARGLSLPDRQTWIVAPVSRTRDSGPLEESNFAAALETLGGESETVEVHRFGHWGPGWFEIILVAPERIAEVQAIADRLESYPSLNDDALSEIELDRACDAWRATHLKERIRICARYRVSIFAARRDELPDDPQGGLISYLAGE